MWKYCIRCGFSNRSSVDAAVSGRHCVFLGQSKITLFGLPGIIKITYNRTATHFMDDRFVNLGEEVILTLLWQSGASESATVCFVISLNICYWLFKCGVLGFKPKQYKQKTYCNKNGGGELIIPCTFEVNVCTGLLFSYSSYHCVVMKSVVPDSFGGRYRLWGALIEKNLNCWNKEF